MREVNAIFDLYSVFASEAKRGAGKIAESIDDASYPYSWQY